MDRRIDRRIEEYIDGERNIQTDRKIDSQIEELQTDRKIDRQIEELQTDRRKDRQIEHIDRQKDNRWTDRTYGQIER